MCREAGALSESTEVPCTTRAVPEPTSVHLEDRLSPRSLQPGTGQDRHGTWATGSWEKLEEE